MLVLLATTFILHVMPVSDGKKRFWLLFQYADKHLILIEDPDSRKIRTAASAALRCVLLHETVRVKGDASCRIK